MPRSPPLAASATPVRWLEIHTILANGGVAKGKRFMSEGRLPQGAELQIEGPTCVPGMPARFGLGFGLAGGTVPLPNPQDSMYWGGYGGSIIDDKEGAHDASPTP